MISLKQGLLAGGAPAMWSRIIQDALPDLRKLISPGCHVLEIGYGDGILSCWLAQTLGWRITGLDINDTCQSNAVENAGRFRMCERVSFECCSPEQTRQHSGQYDAVFIKTVLLYSSDLEEYGRWLDWIRSVLKPGGVFVDLETGRANRIMQIYRRLRQRDYTDLCLYTPAVEALYDTRFEIVYRKYYGGWSQFVSPVSILYRFAAKMEEAYRRRDAGNCFAVGIIGKKV